LRSEYDIEESLLQDLMTFQRTFLIDYNDTQNYTKTIAFKHDIPGYVQNTHDLNTGCTYEFEFPEDHNMSLQRFCEQIFFARRRNFGKSWITRK
jgi:hypothetical protein